MSDKKQYSSLIKSLDDIDVKISPIEPVEQFITGILSIDSVFHGGMPRGKFIEMYGEKNSGKTTTAMLIARQYNLGNEKVCWFDVEDSLDPVYAAKFGWDVHALGTDGLPLLDKVEAVTAEQWLQALREVLKSRYYSFVVIDSLAAMVPKTEYEADLDKGTMGIFPRLVSRFFRTVGPTMLMGCPTTVLILNQQRLDIGNAGPYGAPKIGPGGEAKNHFVAVTLRTLPPKDDTVAEKRVGITQRYQITKSKVFSFIPKKYYNLKILIDEDAGIYEVDFAYELYFAAVQKGLLQDKDGSPWKKNVAFFRGTNLGNGETQILTFLSEPSEVRNAIQAALYETIGDNSDAVQLYPQAGDGRDENPNPQAAQDE